MHRIPQEMRILHKKRLVQAEVGAQLRDLLGRGILAQQKHHRIAHILKQQKSHEGHHRHHQNGLQQALNDKGKHQGGV